MEMEIGDLVQSNKDVNGKLHFSGIGKLHAIDKVKSEVEIVFFVSPSNPDAHRKKLPFGAVKIAEIKEDHNVYHKIEKDYWCQARYGGARPDNQHLLIYNKMERPIVDAEDIYVLNLSFGDEINPEEFLKARCTYFPFFSERRLLFIKSYVEQRAACRSISSLSCSDIELAAHQVAIARRILQDENKKYLLADEVGLGKTIEAGLIISEHILTDQKNACVFVVTPEGLQTQWKQELSYKFYLSDLIEVYEDDEDMKGVLILEHDQLLRALEDNHPTMIVIDEAHQIATWAWETNRKHDYREIASACQQSTNILLLSGTPINHNPQNYLAMLHLLSPDSYKLNEEGIKKFEQRLAQREELGGLYQSFTIDNDDYTLTENLDVMEQKFPNDKELLKEIESVREVTDDEKSIDKAERENKIISFRRFIGENYRIHQRMLRNRREDSKIIQYFPGLKGAKIKRWEVDETTLSIDQQIIEAPNELISKKNYLGWLTLCLQSPSLVADKARDIIDNSAKQSEDDIEFLNNIIEEAEEEQKNKDELLDTILSEWLEAHKKGKIIIFCMIDNLVDHVYQQICKKHGVSVERYNPEEELKFNTDNNIRVLVCDYRGEDGLNLHGGEKLLIHYALPKSLSTIEQRNGRVNRYSANVHAKPIESIILTPNDDRSVIYRWTCLLDNTIKIFNRSIASLQHVLEEEIDKTWGNLCTNGIKEFDTLEANLGGEQGQIELERKKVRAQEQLNLMEDEIITAGEFANELEDADEKAVEQAEFMKNWINDALQFNFEPGPDNNTFRFKYRRGASSGSMTLMSSDDFFDNCIVGINFDESSSRNIVTHWMSPFRALPLNLLKTKKSFYPLRYGQPFVDAIYQSMKTDTRGVCLVLKRHVKNWDIPEKEALFFSINWLVDATQINSSRSQQIIDDERHKPEIIEHWIDTRSWKLAKKNIISVLTRPYNKKLQNRNYSDTNIRTIDEWKTLEEYPGEWSELIDHAVDISKKQLDASLDKDIEFRKKIISINGILLSSS